MKFTYSKGYTGVSLSVPLFSLNTSNVFILRQIWLSYHKRHICHFFATKTEFFSLHFSALWDAPQNVSGFNTSSTSINLTWQLIPYKPRISYYKINITELVSGTLVGQINSTGLVQHIVGLRGYTQYVFTVCGVNTVGDGPSSLPVTISTDMDGKFGLVD